MTSNEVVSWISLSVSVVSVGAAIWLGACAKRDSKKTNEMAKKALEVSLDQTTYKFVITADDEGKALRLFNQSPRSAKDMKISVL